MSAGFRAGLQRGNNNLRDLLSQTDTGSSLPPQRKEAHGGLSCRGAFTSSLFLPFPCFLPLLSPIFPKGPGQV